DDAIASWLESNAFFIGDRWITQNHVLTYALAPSTELTTRPASARLADGVKISSIQAGVTSIRPGGRILVGFHWSPPEAGLTATSARTNISLRLIDPWSQTAASLDRLLVNPAQVASLTPPAIWQAALSAPADAVPGKYRLEARFYDSASGQPVLVADSAGPQKLALEVANLTVEPVDSAMLDRSAPLASDAIPLQPGLYAEQLELAGGPYSQYSHLAANFVWASQADQSGPIIPELGLRDPAGQIVTSAPRPEIDQPTPLGHLRAGERVREHLDLSLRSVAASATYVVVLRTSPDRPWAALGSIEVTVEPTRARTVPMTQTRSDLFDGVIRLVGTNVPTNPVRAGSALTITFDWHAEGRPTAAYTVFVHLVKGSGQPIAQNDAPPGGASRPTTDWVAGDNVEDQHQIALPSTLAAGTYDLVAGLYQADTGRRAAVVGATVDGQTVQLGSITISPP
ncbi:MAG TPA: hypothetical protein VKT80_08060, partial [Chloroflexota bacterium]|nr:hypothetical protein [Chloroflexota bacterium]